jgi:hypothetical protein
MGFKKLFLVVAVVGVMSFANSVEAQILSFDLQGNAGEGLLPGNENPAITESSTGGEVDLGVQFDVALSRLFIDVAWGSANGFTDLTGDVTAMHIHDAGDNDFSSNGGVLEGLNGLSGFDASLSSGGFDGFVDITDAGDIASLLNGNLYINVHTADNGGGELRGNLVAVPEPSSMAVCCLVGIACVSRRRRK